MDEWNELRSTLRTLWADYSPELANDARRVNALLMDYLPQRAKERRLIVSALREGIGADLLAARGKDAASRQLLLDRWVRRLVSDLWLTESAARLAVDVLAGSLGLTEDAPPADTSAPQGDELIKGTLPNAADAQALGRYGVLGYKAFAADNSLTELVIPDGVRVIRGRAFQGCRNLKRVTLPQTLEAMGREVFRGCWSLEGLALAPNKNYVVSGGMLIDRKRNALLRAVRSPDTDTVPQGIEIIRAYAFERSALRELHLPAQLRVIEPNAFAGCASLERLEADRGNRTFRDIDGVLHNRDGRVLLHYPAGRPGGCYILEDGVEQLADAAFEGARLLESITFTGTLRVIGRRAFRGCGLLRAVILPGGVESIGERAFQGCEKLGSVMLSRGIREIGDFAFQGCASIGSVSVPRNVERIGHAAFSGCAGLKRVILQDRISFIGDGAFSGCPDDLEIAVKDNAYVENYCRARGMKYSKL